MKIFIHLVLLLIFCGCAGRVMQRNSDKYARAADSFKEAGEWEKALEPAKRAMINAERAHSNVKNRAILHYEYGRVLGVTCSFQEAEAELKEAYELDQEAKQPLFLSLTELARLNLDQGKYKEANEYFEKSIQELKFAKADQSMPIDFAEVLNEYATSLEKVSDSKKAASIRKEARGLIKNHPSEQSNTDRTPYGKHCLKK